MFDTNHVSLVEETLLNSFKAQVNWSYTAHDDSVIVVRINVLYLLWDLGLLCKIKWFTLSASRWGHERFVHVKMSFIKIQDLQEN